VTGEADHWCLNEDVRHQNYFPQQRQESYKPVVIQLMVLLL
jgi:hypothetical protein